MDHSRRRDGGSYRRCGHLALVAFLTTVCLVPPRWGFAQPADSTVDLDQDRTLYAIGYAHLDTQWRWDFPTTIRHYIPATLHDNFALFEKYPHYVFNFTGSIRYQMMQEYYPEAFERLRDYVRQGRWQVVGSSVDEGDVVVPSTESIVRQILYGNRYFRRTFDKSPVDFMLPDCFGFPASLPSIFAHCGLAGFVTQKLTWGSAVGVPFNLGFWEGPDGRGVVAALNPGPYVHRVRSDMSRHPEWTARIEDLGRSAGVFADYFFYGTGDRGGAPDEESVRWMELSRASDGPLRVALAPADQLFRDLRPEQVARLPRYQGDLLLTEHSAGTLTSQAYMKRWNRKSELLADAAERACTTADWLGGARYPHAQLEASWLRVLGSQMHDILPGTSIPQAYEYSWNDLVLAQNGFAASLTDAMGVIYQALDVRPHEPTNAGVPLVVFNPLSIDREDLVEVEFDLAGPADALEVVAPDGQIGPCQLLHADGLRVRVLFLARVPAVTFQIYEVRRATGSAPTVRSLRVTPAALENDRWRVDLAANGDLAQIFDKRAGRPLLARPAGLVFLHDAPEQWPAWNMDWKDLAAEPYARVDGPAQVRVVENGPLRVALEVTREAQGSRFTQTLRLASGEAGDRIEVVNLVDWYTFGSCLKADFPLAIGNPNATYNWGLGTIERGNNDAKKYEVPSHQWFDLTHRNGSYGVSILEDCKYGSDKPADDHLRLTLIRTPVANSYGDQATQDQGRHEFTYAVAGHAGDWRVAQVPWRAARLNQPLLAFRPSAPQQAHLVGGSHTSASGDRPGDRTKRRQLSLLRVSTPQVAVRAIKKSEDGDAIIVRVQELEGRPASAVQIDFAADVVSAWEVDGQEQRVGPARVVDGALTCDLDRYRLQAYAVKLAAPTTPRDLPRSRPIPLPYDVDVASSDAGPGDGDFDGDGSTYPAEQLPATLTHGDVEFRLGPTGNGQLNAVACAGQKLTIEARPGERVYVLAAADTEVPARFEVGSRTIATRVQAWTGKIGQWDNRSWRGDAVIDIESGYVRRQPVAWFATHRHLRESGNDPYAFTYLYLLSFSVPADGAQELTLPDDARVKVFAVTVASRVHDVVEPGLPLYDTLDSARPVARPAIVSDPTHGTGKFLDRTAVALACATAGAEIRFTLDGSPPTAESALYREPIVIQQTLTLRAKAFHAGTPPSLSLARDFTRVTAAPAFQVSDLRPGLLFEYHELAGMRRLPDFSSLQPARTGVSEGVDIAVRGRDEDFALRFLGFVRVPETGVYTFELSSDDGSRLAIDGVTVIDHDGLHGASGRTAAVALVAGLHALRVEYFERGGDESLELMLQGPGMERGPLPADALFHQQL
ncbi:MAG: glycoside hydrolase family 38 C-terminal domain-containing protein [Planctomycetota bacterium]